MKNVALIFYLFSVVIVSAAMQEKVCTTQIFIIQHYDNSTPVYQLLKPDGDCEKIQTFAIPVVPCSQICAPPNSEYHYIQSLGDTKDTLFDLSNIKNTYCVPVFTQNQKHTITNALDNQKHYSVIVKITTSSSADSQTQNYFRVTQITSDYPVIFTKITNILGVIALVGITVTAILLVVAKRYLYSRG